MVNYLCQIVSILLYSKNLGHDKRNNYEGRNETTITTQYDLEKSFEVYMKGDAKKCFLLQLWATFIFGNKQLCASEVETSLNLFDIVNTDENNMVDSTHEHK